MLNKLLNGLFLLIPFIEYSYSIHLQYFDFRCSYLIYISYFLVYGYRFFKSFPIKDVLLKYNYFVILLFIILFFQIYNIIVGNNTLFLFLKQFIIISFVFCTTVVFFYNNKNNLKEIFKLYIDIAFVISLIGLFQEFSWLIGFKHGYDFSWFTFQIQIGTSGFMYRATSICAEPSALAFSLIPAVYISLNSFLTNNFSFVDKKKAFTIICCLLFTYSTLGYFSLFISFVLIISKNIKHIKILQVLIFFIISLFIFSFGSNGIIMRVSDTISVIIKQDNKKQEQEQKKVVEDNIEKKLQTKNINVSTRALVIHSKIVLKNLEKHLLFGTGLGTYINTYKKYSDLFVVIGDTGFPSQTDAASVFLRLASEAGAVTIIILLYFLIYSYIWSYKKYTENLDFLIVLNNAAFVLILLRLIRGCTYYGEHFFFYLILFYYTKKLFIRRNNIKVI